MISNLLQTCRKLYSIQHLLSKRNQSSVSQNDQEKVNVYIIVINYIIVCSFPTWSHKNRYYKSMIVKNTNITSFHDAIFYENNV